MMVHHLIPLSVIVHHYIIHLICKYMWRMSESQNIVHVVNSVEFLLYGHAKYYRKICGLTSREDDGTWSLEFMCTQMQQFSTQTN